MNRSSRKTLMTVVGTLTALAVLAGGSYWWSQRDTKPQWRFATIDRGPLTGAVSASGTLNPVKTVQIGSQVSGQIQQVLVDFNSPVKSGQIVARIDPAIFESRVRQAGADLDAARAALLVQQAELNRQQVNADDAWRDLERKKSLQARGFISPADLDKSQAVWNALNAQVSSARAQVTNAQAQIRQREALLAQARTDLEKTIIRAPVDGVVIKRSVEPGQTVAASLQAPELFVIAQSLADMQVEVAVDESDVGRIREGQKATFTVDAFAGRQFEGDVMQVRKAAQNVQNVVTYVVVVSAANPDLHLLPGMTANVRIVTDQRADVLRVPNSALRFRPPGEAAAADAGGRDRAAGDGHGGGTGGPLQAFRERLVKAVQPDARQTERIDAILAAQRDKFRALRELPEDQRRKAGDAQRAEMRAAVGAVLRPEQQKAYTELIAEIDAARAQGGQSGGPSSGSGRIGSGRVWMLDERGKPRAVAVRTGLSDGTLTEIVSGEVQAGRQVLVGTVSTPSSASSGSPSRPAGGPRMF